MNSSILWQGTFAARKARNVNAHLVPNAFKVVLALDVAQIVQNVNANANLVVLALSVAKKTKNVNALLHAGRSLYALVALRNVAFQIVADPGYAASQSAA